MAQTHIIAEGSGIGSGSACNLLPWKHYKVRHLSHDYPFIGGRTPQSMRWVAVEFADGTVGTYPRNRVVRVA